MRKLKLISWFAVLNLAASLVACSGSSSGGDGGSGLNSGVDSDKLGEDLSSGEVRDICEATSDYVNDKVSSSSFEQKFCQAVGVAVAVQFAGSVEEDQLQDLCEQATDVCNDCQDNPGMDGCEDIAFEPEATDCSATEVPSDCTATVGELEKCLKDYVDASLAGIDSIPSCSKVDASTDVSGLGADPELPRSCDVVEEKCPDALP